MLSGGRAFETALELATELAYSLLARLACPCVALMCFYCVVHLYLFEILLTEGLDVEFDVPQRRILSRELTTHSCRV